MKPQILEDHVRWSIYSYPAHYRGKNYGESRLRVLEHIFALAGTGMEWHPSGVLMDMKYPRGGGVCYDDSKVKKTLPKNFFEMELWDFDVDSSRKRELHERLGKCFHYFRKNDRERTFRVVLEAPDKSSAQILCNEFGSKFRYKNPSPMKAKAEQDWYPVGRPPVCPYTLCEYAPIVEMLNGKTNSPHLSENFEITYIQPDWISGALDIVEYSIDYYNDEEKYKFDHYYPRVPGGPYKWDTEEVIARRQKSYEHKLKYWPEYRVKQLDILTRFLEKFKPE